MQPFYKVIYMYITCTDRLKHHSYEQDIQSHLQQTEKIQIKAIKFRKRQKRLPKIIVMDETDIRSCFSLL